MQQLPKLSSDILKELQKRKNLLAFSAGTDSSALFFILHSYNIEFDIALVNYKTREQSDNEERYAKELAKKYNKHCYTFMCKLENNNFEHIARNERYAFFEKLINEHSYENLITAHHLNDRFEWLLMQLSKGAGLAEMYGMNDIEEKSDYKIIRPLLSISKKEIEEFLSLNNIKYFFDESNKDKHYKRNHIRQAYADTFMEEFSLGVKRSFEYLKKDVKALYPKQIKQIKQLYILEKSTDDTINMRGIDKIVKTLGVLLSAAQREEILKTKDCVVAGKIAISFNEELIFIAPTKDAIMPKKFKEACRNAKIPSKVRSYMYKENIHPKELTLPHRL